MSDAFKEHLEHFKYTNRPAPVKYDEDAKESFASEAEYFKFQHNKLNGKSPVKTTDVKPNIDASPEAIALHLVSHIEKLNKQLRKTQDRLGKVRASNRRLKHQLLEENNATVKLYNAATEECDHWLARNNELFDIVDSFNHLVGNLYYKSSK